jgi:hypothetical protein
VTPEESTPTLVPTPGYLGLRERSIEVDWKKVADHGPCVIVAYRGPAWRAGVRSKDFVVSINGRSYDAFHSAMPEAGTLVVIVVWRKGLGRLIFAGQLGTVPKPRTQPSSPLFAATSPGKSVTKKERPIFIGFISKHPDLEALDTRLLCLLLNYEGERGIFPKRRMLAHSLRRSLSTLDRSKRRCQRAGMLRVQSGKLRRRSNNYFVTWPMSHPRSKNWTD